MPRFARPSPHSPSPPHEGEGDHAPPQRWNESLGWQSFPPPLCARERVGCIANDCTSSPHSSSPHEGEGGSAPPATGVKGDLIFAELPSPPVGEGEGGGALPGGICRSPASPSPPRERAALRPRRLPDLLPKSHARNQSPSLTAAASIQSVTKASNRASGWRLARVSAMGSGAVTGAPLSSSNTAWPQKGT